MQLATIEGLKLVNRVSTSGANLGQRMAFHDKGTPAEMRAEFKKAGMKGTALSKAVRDAVKGNKGIAWVRFQALTQMAQTGGFIPTQSDINKGGNKIKMELVLPVEPKTKATPAAPAIDPEKVIADRMGIKIEELRQLYASK